MSKQCPSCGSQDVRKASVAYDMGVQKTKNRTIGGGVALSLGGPIVGVGAAASRGRNISDFAERVAPPKAATMSWRTIFIGLICAMSLFMGLMSMLVGGPEVISVLGFVFLNLLIFGPLLAWCIRRDRKRRVKTDHEMADWQRLYVCERCGEVFDAEKSSEPGSDGPKQENSSSQNECIGKILN